jgi:hypothetical protein
VTHGPHSRRKVSRDLIYATGELMLSAQEESGILVIVWFVTVEEKNQRNH